MVLNRNVVTASPSSASMPVELPIAEPAPKLVSVAPGNPLPEPTPQPPVQQVQPQAEAPQVNAAAPANPAPTQLATTAPLDQLASLARSGDMKAERDLGLKYLAGDGVQADESEAARWLMRAAYRGEPTAEYWLGTLYARGHGVPEDAFQANHWYEAAAQGQPPRYAQLRGRVLPGLGRGEEFCRSRALVPQRRRLRLRRLAVQPRGRRPSAARASSRA